MRRHAAGRAALSILSILISFSSCSRREQGDAAPLPPVQIPTTPEPGGTLYHIYTFEPATLNTLLDTSDANSTNIAHLVQETLVTYDQRTLEKIPGLAESWEVSPDKLTFTFRLRRGVRWHDGRPFTARDVEYTFKAMRDPKSLTTDQKLYFKDCIGMKVIDDYAVQFKWSRPYFLALGAMDNLKIYPAHLYGGKDFNTHPLNRAPVGTGPFKFVEWKTGQHIVLERNDDYWGKKPYIKRMVARFITDEAVRFQAFKRGDIDLVRFTPEQWKHEGRRYLDDPSYVVKEFAHPGYGYFMWNMRRLPFNDRRVRRAMTMLVDREGIKKNVYHGLAKIMTGPFLPGSKFNNDSVDPIPYDPQGAKRLLSEAGWRDSDRDGVLDRAAKKFEFDFQMSSGGPEAMQVPTIFKESLAKVGIVMNIKVFEWSTFLKNMQDRKIDAGWLGWRLGHESDAYQLWHSSQVETGSNYPGFQNPEADRLIEEGRREFDEEKRAALYRRLHRIIHEEQPYTFLFQYKRKLVHHRRIQGLDPLPILTYYDIRDWWIPRVLRRPGDTS